MTIKIYQYRHDGYADDNYAYRISKYDDEDDSYILYRNELRMNHLTSDEYEQDGQEVEVNL